MDDNGHAWAHVIFFDEVHQGRNVVQRECLNAVRLRRRYHFGDIGDHGHGVACGHFLGNVKGKVARELRNGRFCFKRCFNQDLVIGVVRGRKTAHELREVSLKGKAALGSFHEHARNVGIGRVSGAHDFNGGQAAFSVAFDHNNVVTRHAANDLAAFQLFIERFYARKQGWGRNDGLRCARRAVAKRVFTRMVDLEVHVMVVFDAANVVSARNEFGNNAFNQGCFA